MGKLVMRCLTCATLLFTILLSSCASTQTAQREQKQADIYIAAGVEALSESRFTDALISFSAVTKLLPKSELGWNNLGIAYYGKGEAGKAEESWKKAISLNKEFSDAHNNLGSLYLQQKKYSLSEYHFKEALKNLLYNKSSQANFNLSLLYDKLNKPLLAEQHLKLAVQDNPNFCQAWFQLGILQKNRGEISAAEESMKKSSTGTCFNNPEAHYEVGNLYLKVHDTPKAKSKFLEIIELFPASEWAKKAEITLNMLRE